MITHEPVPSAFPFRSHYLTIKGAKLHYIDEGEGDPVVFLHGIPASNYVWRNILPTLTPHARCIALDLIGMGKSDKPDISYRIFDHIDYIEAFIKALDLENITFVLHGWGSVIGFNYAAHHPKNVRGLAFYESHVKPITEWHMLSLPVQQMATILQNPHVSYRAIVEEDYVMEELLPKIVLRELTPAELSNYKQPFNTSNSRKLFWQYIQDLPLGRNSPEDVVKLMNNYANFLQHSKLPKLLLYAIPGLITPVSTLEWCKTHLPNLVMADLGEALHFAQETNPSAFREALKNWYATI
jgi:haloalkane dehalogenase